MARLLRQEPFRLRGTSFDLGLLLWVALHATRDDALSGVSFSSRVASWAALARHRGGVLSGVSSHVDWVYRNRFSVCSEGVCFLEATSDWRRRARPARLLLVWAASLVLSLPGPQ